MHDLFHYYCLVLPELPYLRKMQGKTPFDTPWKTPLPRHEKQPSVPAFGRTSSTSSALKGEGMQHHKGKKESLPAGLLMSSPPRGIHDVDHVSATAGWQGQALAHRVQKQGGAVVQCSGTFAPGGT